MELEKIVERIISLLEDQEGVKIEYEIEKTTGKKDDASKTA